MNQMFIKLGVNISSLLFILLIFTSLVSAVCDELPANGTIDSDIILNPNCTYYIDHLFLQRGIIFDGRGATITTKNSISPLLEGHPSVFKNIFFKGVNGENTNFFVLGYKDDNDPIQMSNIKALTRGRTRPVGWVNICNISINHFNPEDAKLNMSPNCYYKINYNQIDLNTDYFCNGAMIEPLFNNSSSIMSMVENPNSTITDCLFNNTRFALSTSYDVYSTANLLIKNSVFFNMNFSQPTIYLNTGVYYPVIEFETGKILVPTPPQEWIDSWKSYVNITNNTFFSTLNKTFIKIASNPGDNLSSKMNIFIYDNTFVNGILDQELDSNFSKTFYCINGTGNIFLNSTYKGPDYFNGTCHDFVKLVNITTPDEKNKNLEKLQSDSTDNNLTNSLNNDLIMPVVKQQEKSLWSNIVLFFKKIF